jgi:hypothetical protein
MTWFVLHTGINTVSVHWVKASQVCLPLSPTNSSCQILRYPAHRYHAVSLPGFEPTTLWLRVRHPNHLATTLHILWWF